MFHITQTNVKDRELSQRKAYTEVLPATAVSNAVTLPFLSSTSTNLAVAKTSLLQIFSLKTVTANAAPNIREEGSKHIGSRQERLAKDGIGDPSLYEGDIVPQRLERVQTSKLVLEAEYPISGEITSLARIKISGSVNGADALLVGIKDAKISLVAWDPNRHAIYTVSIHYYESENLQRCPWSPALNQNNSTLTVDPGNRCAALKFGPRNLAILPFRHAGNEDLDMDDYDPDLDGERPQSSGPENGINGKPSSVDTPYGPSFVLSLTLLDPSLVYPLHLSFLYEYREPTFGILSSFIGSTPSLQQERQDILSYSIFTLDLDQRASTTLLSVSGLPSDLTRIIPLKAPVGGALLVGSNELVHIDQAGKISAIAVNEFARQNSALGMADYSSLAMRLEWCEIVELGIETGDMLIILQSGELAILEFRLDGRTVSGLKVGRVDATHGGSILLNGASCTSLVGRGRIFVGGDNTDSVILGWTRGSTKSEGVDANNELDFEEMQDYDDDLYAETGNISQDDEAPASSKRDKNYVFRVHDKLTNLAPLRDLKIGKSNATKERLENSSKIPANPEIVAACGSGRAGAITILKPYIEPAITETHDLPTTQSVWMVRARRPALRGLPQPTGRGPEDNSADSLHDRYMVRSSIGSDGKESSAIFNVSNRGFETLKDTEFDGAGGTVEVGTLSRGTRIIQVLKGEIRSFDGDLGLTQIYPMTDELTGAEPKVVSASFADPYLLLVRDDSSILVISSDNHGDLEEIERGDALLSMKWISGSLYRDDRGVFNHKTPSKPNKKDVESTVMFLLSAQGGLHVYALPDLTVPIFVAEGLSFLHPTINPEPIFRRSPIRETLVEVLVADLGDNAAKSAYLFLRTASDDVTMYEPFHCVSTDGSSSGTSTIRFNKLSKTAVTSTPFDSNKMVRDDALENRHNPMRALSDLEGYNAVFLPGDLPSFAIKSAASMPRVLRIKGGAIRSISSFHTASSEHGFVYIDGEGSMKIAHLPEGFEFGELGWAVHRIQLGQEVQCIAYHEPMHAYVLATNVKTEFELPKDDDFHRNWAKEDISFKPLVDQSVLRLMNPATWTFVDSFELEPNEVVLTAETIELEVSEVTRKRAPVILVGTCISNGVDLPTKGNIYALTIIPVVPVPGHPETAMKIKQLGKEGVKGAVTSLSTIGKEGFFLTANGQKCMVRGLKEDGTMLPVAFLDVQTHVSAAKALPGTGLCLVADALKGLWFAGYNEDPYKITLFGKTSSDISFVAAEFLPEDNQLYLVAYDPDLNMHILQYDPENPKSLSGQRLLPRSTFHTGQYVSSATLLPNIPPFASSSQGPDDPPPPEPRQILITTRSGSLAVVQTLPAHVYSTLSSLATHLNTVLEHAGGLNPRAYRRAAADGMGGRVVLDGGLLHRFWELGCGKRADVLGRVGAEATEIRDALRWVGSGGLPF